jgi:hypothetical protein
MMKKTAILALSAVLASQLMGAEDLSEMIKEGKAGGYIRMHHIFPEASSTVAETGSVIGGKLKYQTGALYGLRFGAAFYAAHDTGLTKEDYLTRDGYSHVEQGLRGDDMGNYSTLGEAYASYHLSNTDITYGRQEFKTPMTESQVTLIPNLFEGTVATIKELPNTTITAAHILKMQYGTRTGTEAALTGDGVYGITAGAGYGFVSPVVNGTTGVITAGQGKESFQDMSIAMMGKTANMDTAGVTALGIDYTQGDLKLRAWDYYAHEIYNTIYADAEYKINTGSAKVTLGAQILKQDDVGDFTSSSGATQLKTLRTLKTPSGTNVYNTKISADGSIDALLWGAKAQAEVGDFTFMAAFNKNEDGHVINTWGGDPGYTSTQFGRNEYRADTTAYKLGAEYNLQSFVPGLRFIYNVAHYSTDVQTWTNATTISTLRSEDATVHDYTLHYAVPSVKGLWFRLFFVDRENPTRDYTHNHTRLIANLSF